MSFVYRVLREDECLTWETEGLVAKDPSADLSVEEYVSRRSPFNFASQYISTCRTLSAAMTSNRSNEQITIVAIDIEKAQKELDEKITTIDISTHDNARLHIQDEWEIDFAAKLEEILIIGTIPASCISLQTNIEIKIHFIYRVLREGEHSTWETEGLVAKNPDADVSVEDHVSRGSQSDFASQYISTCRTLNAARAYASSKFIKTTTIVAINLKKAIQELHVSNKDISTIDNARRHIQNEWAIDFAAKFEEILIIGAIPASCISLQTTIEIKRFFVYRLLREDEHSIWETKGLAAKNPAADISVEKHVSTGSSHNFASQYISASRTLSAVKLLTSYNIYKSKIVAIDIVKALHESNVQIIDISNKDNACGVISNQDSIAINFAQKFEEILIVGVIPASCILLSNVEE